LPLFAIASFQDISMAGRGEHFTEGGFHPLACALIVLGCGEGMGVGREGDRGRGVSQEA
jgi:hypothetical protein